MNLRKKVEQLFANSANQLSKYKYAVAIFLIGIIFIVLGGGHKEEATQPVQIPVETSCKSTFDLQEFETDLKESLSKIDGAGRIELMLTLASGEESVYAQDERENNSGGSTVSYERSVTVVSDGSYGQAPISLKKLYPTFRGAVVLCDGADNDLVRYAVTKAVSTLCGIGTDKVTVLKMTAGA